MDSSLAASKKKGIWVGGPLPLGYEMREGKISIVEEEAERVRSIFGRYLELGAVHPLLRDLRERNVLTKRRPLKTGVVRGGVNFCKGALFYLLRNRFYIGEVNYKGQIYPSEQPPITDRRLFDAVQQQLTDQWTHHTRTRSKFSFLLTGLIFDDAGHRMAPTQAKKKGINYRYYVSRALLFGEAATARVGSVPRVPAAEVEALVSKTILEPQLRGNESCKLDNEFARSKIERIEIQSDQILVWAKQDSIVGVETAEDASPILIPWKKPPSKKPRDILLPKNAPVKTRPMKLERRATLVAAIAGGRRWLDEIVSGRDLHRGNRHSQPIQRAACLDDNLPGLPFPCPRRSYR